MAMILLSYGKMAADILNSVQLLTGKSVNNVSAFGLKESDDPDILSQKVNREISKYYDDEVVYIVFDYRGGTPGNIAIGLTQDYPQLQVISGLNLPLVLNYISQETDFKKTIQIKKLVSVGQDGVSDVTDYLRNRVDEGDEFE